MRRRNLKITQGHNYNKEWKRGEFKFRPYCCGVKVIKSDIQIFEVIIGNSSRQQSALMKKMGFSSISEMIDNI